MGSDKGNVSDIQFRSDSPGSMPVILRDLVRAELFQHDSQNSDQSGKLHLDSRHLESPLPLNHGVEIIRRWKLH